MIAPLQSLLPIVDSSRRITSEFHRWLQEVSRAVDLERDSHNASVASQGAGFSTDTYADGSDVEIPKVGLGEKTLLQWTISASKTAAGVATPVYSIRFGSARSTADTARLQITGPAQTAAADVGVISIRAVVRSVGTSGVIQGTASVVHNGALAGFTNNVSGVVQATSAGFDNRLLGGQFVGLSINAGAAAAWTITQSIASAVWR